MSKQHTVRSGDCISSLAYDNGFFAGTLWDLPENALLKELRDNMNVLIPGDIVHIPDKRQKEHHGSTDARHIFRRRGVPARLAVRIMRGGYPRSNTPYVLTVDRHKLHGFTDANGEITIPILPNAESGLLQVGSGEDIDKYPLLLGHLQPSDTVLGVQARLRNLGYSCGDEDGHLGVRTKAAICDFQQHHRLVVTGEMDAAFLAFLVKIHDED